MGRRGARIGAMAMGLALSVTACPSGGSARERAVPPHPLRVTVEPAVFDDPTVVPALLYGQRAVDTADGFVLPARSRYPVDVHAVLRGDASGTKWRKVVLPGPSGASLRSFDGRGSRLLVTALEPVGMDSGRVIVRTSADGGRSWRASQLVPGTDGLTEAVGDTAGAVWHDQWWVVGAARPGPGGAVRPVVWMSRDNANFLRIDGDLPAEARPDGRARVLGGRLWIGTASGTYATADGRHWTRDAGDLLVDGGGRARVHDGVEVAVGTGSFERLPRPSSTAARGYGRNGADDSFDPTAARPVGGSWYLQAGAFAGDHGWLSVVLRRNPDGRWGALALPFGACGPPQPRGVEDLGETTVSTELPVAVGRWLVVLRRCDTGTTGRQTEAFASPDRGRTWRPLAVPASVRTSNLEAVLPADDHVDLLMAPPGTEGPGPQRIVHLRAG